MPELGISWPTYNLVTAYVTVNGIFNCRNSSNGLSLFFTLQSMPLNDLSKPLPLFPQSCNCPNCVTQAQLSPWPYTTSLTWAGYNYSGLNTLQVINTTSTNFCLSSVELTLEFDLGAPQVQKTIPTGGPKSGGTHVTLYGTNFYESQTIVCRFGTIVNRTIAQLDRGLDGSIHVICPSPAFKPLSTSTSPVVGIFLYVANTDGQSFEIYDPTPFSYYDDPSVTSINPTSGSENGGTWVSISGENFVPILPTCLFGDNATTAEVVKPSVVKCISPAGSGSVTLRFSPNGQQFIDAGTFTYTSDGSDNSDQELIWIFFGAGFGVAVLVAVTFILLRYRNRYSQAYLAAQEEGAHSPFLGGRKGVQIGINNKDRVVLAGNIEIGDLEIQERIGRGTHGEVFKAIWSGTEVAVKNLPQTHVTQEFLDDIKREAQIMRTLRHPNVLQFLGAAMSTPNFFIVMEYMSRGSLFNIIHDPHVQLSWPLIQGMMLDAARGMNYLHHLNPPIVHRDLKSHNLLVDENWKVKVCDFGLCRILTETPENTTLTACGTPCWAAPEILRNQKYDSKADVYSFGIVLWECSSRKVPFEGMPPFQVVYAVATEKRRPTIPPGVSLELVHLMTDCWGEHARNRPSFDIIITRLSSITEGFRRLQTSSSPPAKLTLNLPNLPNNQLRQNVNTSIQETPTPVRFHSDDDSSILRSDIL